MFFNAWAIAAGICTIFTAILAIFLFSLNSRAWYTRSLAWMFVAAFFMDLGFFLGAALPYPFGAYHRFLTVPGALFGSFFLFQFAFAFPRRFAATWARKYLYYALTALGLVIATGLTVWFIYEALVQEPRFVFEGNLYNYSSDLGRPVARGILFQVGIFLVLAIIRAVYLRGEERTAVIQMAVALLLATLGPGIVNLLHQRELVTHGTFQQFFVLFTLLGYFTFTIVFINNTVDRTSFMTKIVGISVVTMLLVIQGLSTVVNLQKEKYYDQIHSKNSREFLVNYELPVGARYVFSYPGRNLDSTYDALILHNTDALAVDSTVLSGLQAQISEALAAGPDGRQQRRFQGADGQEAIYFSYYVRDLEKDRIYEIGYPYLQYRGFVNETGRNIAIFTGVLVFVVLVLYPIFFSRSLVRPLNNLLEGVGSVNEGNLMVKIPVMVQDEIGYLSESFNRMVKSILDSRVKLQEYADTLEEKVKERTKDLNEKMEEVQALKVQQDGDYFLTALIAKPLATNWNKSYNVTTEFYIEQKKKFAFRERDSELGGDICITGNLRFQGEQDRWVFFVNGDAMGKSMQGAGGAIVLGTSVNNIMARSAGEDNVLDMSPHEWLRETWRELHSVFLTFDGMMMASVAMGLLHETDGRLLYVNAEHPWTVRYRDGKAEFIEHELLLRKLGSPSEFEFRIQEHQLEPGDVLFLGSDGREDIDITPGESVRTINEDERLFLIFVEESRASLDGIVGKIHGFGAATDDLSLMRIGFQEVRRSEASPAAGNGSAAELLLAGRLELDSGNVDAAIAKLKAAADADPRAVEPLRLLGQAYYDRAEYADAAYWLESCLELDSSVVNLWFLLSVCYKQERRFEQARDAGEKVRELQPHRLANLINLSDSYRILGDPGRARELVQEALRIEPDNRAALQVDGLLKAKGY